MNSVFYILDAALPCGGVKVICEHISRLSARGLSACLLYSTVSPVWFKRHVESKQIKLPNWNQFLYYSQNYFSYHGQNDLPDVRGIKVATVSYTAQYVHDSLRDGDVGCCLAQDIDEETYFGRERATIFDLGLNIITENSWVANQISSKYGAQSENVRLGIDFSVFFPQPELARESARIFTQYRPEAGDNDLKGWKLALETIVAVKRRIPATSLVTFGRGPAPAIPSHIAHIHLQGATDDELRRVYCESSLFLFTSKHEGFGLPPAEAMACNCPVVSTYAHGNEEFCIDGETCLMGRTAFELSEQCIKLLNQPKRYEPMAHSARELIQSRYQWDDVIDRLEAFYARIS